MQVSTRRLKQAGIIAGTGGGIAWSLGAIAIVALRNAGDGSSENY